MDFSDLRVGMMLPGEFRRLAPHQGALQAWHDSGLPKPTRIVGGSAGAIMGVACAPWNEKNFRHVHEVIANLRARDIFSVPMEHKISAVLAAGTLAFPLLNHLEPEMTPARRVMLHSGQTLAGIALGVWVVRKMFSSPALFNNTPLVRLLERSYDASAVAASEVEVRVMATDIETGEHVAYSTKDPDIDITGLVGRVIASSTLPIHFPLRRLGGRLLTDAEVVTNFPITQLEDMDVVFVFCYSRGLGQYPTPTTWGEHFSGMWDIAKAASNRQARMAYEKRQQEDPTLPEVVFIITDRPIPPLTLQEFTREALERSMHLGGEIIEENLELIGNALGRALARKEMM